jgi:small GTP-binding protein
MSNEQNKMDLKIIILGNSGTGKTSLCKKWIGEERESIKPTIITEYFSKIYVYNDKAYRIQLWDIGGQDKSNAIGKVFSKDSHGCILVSDVNNNQSLEDTIGWKSTIEDDCKFVDGEKIPFLLLRNKIDTIKSEKEKESLEKETKTFSEENEFDLYGLTSALEDINVQESINSFVEHIINRLNQYLSKGNTISDRDTIKIRNHSGIRRRSGNKKCC